MRRVDGENSMSPALRASWEQGRAAASVFVERAPVDSLQRVEGRARLYLPFNLAASAAVSRSSPILGSDAPATLAYRGELGVRTGRVWWTGGVLFRDTTAIPAAVAFDTTFRGGAAGRTTGYFASVQGKFYRDVGLDVVGVRYASAGLYRPQYEARSRIYVDSDMRAKFPSGNLNILVAVTHEYRSQAIFPTSQGLINSSQYRTWGAELEIRLLSATLTFLYRNFLAEEYQQVPGFVMPGITSFYGIRWNFVN
jgi:hypothetical protein